MQEVKTYFKNIDFLRFMLCLAIVLRHINNALEGVPERLNIPLYNHIVANNTFGNVPVDCFFIISGFFLFFTTDFAQNFYQFAKKKLVRLLPVAIFGTLLYKIIYSALMHGSFKLYKDIWVVFMLHNVGFTNHDSTLANTWYISVLFWVSCLFFYLYKIVDKKWFNLILSVVLFIAYAFYANSSLDNPLNAYYVINKGVMRGLGGMAFGYFILQFYNDVLKNIRFGQCSILTRLICTGLEGMLIVFIFNNFFSIHSMSYENRLLLVLLFAVLMILFIIKQGYISKFLENNFSVFVGKFAYSIFVTHVIFRNIWAKYVYVHHPEIVLNYPVWNVVIIYVCSILFGVATYYLIERPAIKFFSKAK